MEELKRYEVQYTKGYPPFVYVTGIHLKCGFYGDEFEGFWIGYAHNENEAIALERKAYYERFKEEYHE